MAKVIDFGVAKAVNQRLSEHTLQTGFHQMIGTPLYMSPEQAEMSPLDVDTRADVYALGVLLYELLTGTTPFEQERLGKASYDEIRRMVRDEELLSPSRCRSPRRDGLPPGAAKRRTEPRQLLRTVRGELDWIVMKCLEKDRNRRYETASAFAAAVQRYLQDEPVQACPPSAIYRFRKFARRNKALFMTVSVIGVALLVAVATLAVSGVLVWPAKDDLQEALGRERQALERERRESYLHRIALAHRELSADNLGRALQLLDECPEDLREWEWYYLKRLCRVDPFILRDTSEIHCAAFHPGGEQVAA